ncbi:MAG TPA: class I SAM-dependent methyltransferase [Victivallales bacterium]|nr:class I SAM-dependent methyltransferase [Victivallales bacterium]
MNYNYDQETSLDYKKAKKNYVYDIQDYSLYNYIKNIVTQKKIIDFACGYGHITRKLHEWGAGSIVGVDVSKYMIELAKIEELNNPVGIKYIHADASNLKKIDEFDIATASWLFECSKNKIELLDMMKSIARNLKLGGKLFCIGFIGCFERLNLDYSKQGLFIETYSKNNDIAKVKFSIQNPKFKIDSNHYSKKVMEKNLEKAGFQNIIWHDLVLPEKIIKDKELFEIWSEYIAKPHSAILECTKGYI